MLDDLKWQYHHLVGANIFFACVHGPYRKQVEHRLMILPREYIVAKGTGFPRSSWKSLDARFNERKLCVRFSEDITRTVFIARVCYTPCQRSQRQHEAKKHKCDTSTNPLLICHLRTDWADFLLNFCFCSWIWIFSAVFIVKIGNGYDKSSVCRTRKLCDSPTFIPLFLTRLRRQHLRCFLQKVVGHAHCPVEVLHVWNVFLNSVCHSNNVAGSTKLSEASISPQT